jgi:uncharacterized lipoprotein
MMTHMRSVLVCLAVVLLSEGCFLFKNDLDKCREFREYQRSEPAPRAVVPDDLQDLPDDKRLQVPYGETNRQPTPSGQPCLIEPPDFFDQSPV